MTESDDANLVVGWRAAVGRADVVSALEGIYAEVAAAIAERGPACWASGRCCNFDRAGHRLYATGLETAYTLARLASPLAAGTLDEAIARGGCPFQVRNLCGVHAIRPLGCRVYFCDRSARDWQKDLYERAIDRLRRLHERFEVEYRYGEWREMLRMFGEAGAAAAGSAT